MYLSYTDLTAKCEYTPDDPHNMHCNCYLPEKRLSEKVAWWISSSSQPFEVRHWKAKPTLDPHHLHHFAIYNILNQFLLDVFLC